MDRGQELREGVRGAYSAVAEQPAGEHPFAVGQRFAEGLGYPRELLERLPRVAVEAFTGVSNVSLFADLPAGARVLDLGCGAGMDSLIAAERVGPRGAVLGVDFSPAMLARARQAALDARADNTPRSGSSTKSRDVALAARPHPGPLPLGEGEKQLPIRWQRDLAAERLSAHPGTRAGTGYYPEQLGAGGASVWFCQAEAERLPLASGSIDVVLVNGIFNLNLARGAIFQELRRVVKPGGAVYAAELIRREPALPGEETSLDDWFA